MLPTNVTLSIPHTTYSLQNVVAKTYTYITLQPNLFVKINVDEMSSLFTKGRPWTALERIVIDVLTLERVSFPFQTSNII